MPGRIDYARIKLPQDVDACAARVYDLTELAETISRREQESGMWYGKTQSYQFQLKRWVGYWNCWGPLADVLFRHLSVSLYVKSITRLDWRQNVEGDTFDTTALEQHYDYYNRGKRRVSIHKYSIATRNRREGRDAGGKGIAMGGKESPRRMTYYERGKEGPAVEFQANGQFLANLVHSAYTTYLAREEAVFADVMSELLQNEADKFCAEKLGFGTEVLVKGLFEQMEINSAQESFLEQFDAFWDKADADAKEVIKQRINDDEWAEFVELGLMDINVPDDEPIIVGDVETGPYESDMTDEELEAYADEEMRYYANLDTEDPTRD